MADAGPGQGQAAVRILRNWGQGRRYHHVVKGYNYRMDGLQGAILRVKLRYLETWNEARRAYATRYHELLAESGVGNLVVMPYSRHVFHIYAVRVKERG